MSDAIGVMPNTPHATETTVPLAWAMPDAAEAFVANDAPLSANCPKKRKVGPGHPIEAPEAETPVAPARATRRAAAATRAMTAPPVAPPTRSRRGAAPAPTPTPATATASTGSANGYRDSLAAAAFDADELELLAPAVVRTVPRSTHTGWSTATTAGARSRAGGDEDDFDEDDDDDNGVNATRRALQELQSQSDMDPAGVFLLS